MNTSQGRIFYATGIDNSQLRNDAAESRNILHSIGQTAKQEGATIDNAFSKIAAAAGGIFAAGKIQEYAREIIKVRGEIESLQISFETLAGEVKGNALFSEIRQFATSTPMMMKDLAQGAQTMLAFNIEVEKVMPMLRAIGDISMGDAQKFNSLSLSFSQMSATGKLMGQDLLQMINAGFNPLSVISEKTGKSIGELKDEMEKGKITVDMVTEAFIAATSEGGKFYGMLEKQSHGIEGAISNLQGAIDDLYNSFGEASQGVITGAIDGATYLVKNYEAVAEILGVIIGTYGIYKAAIIATEAVQRSVTTIKHTEEAAQIYAVMTAEQKAKISKLGLVETTEAYHAAVIAEMKTEMERQIQIAQSAQLELTAARERLATAESAKVLAAEKVASLQAEVAAAYESAAAEQEASIIKKIATEREAQSRAALLALKLQENKNAAIAQATALKEAGASQEIIAAKNREIATISEKLSIARAEEVQHSRNIVALRKEMAAQVDATTSKKIATAEAALETAQENLNTASKNRNTAAREVQSKAAAVNTAVRKAGTIETTLDTAAESANATATGFLTAAKANLTQVVKRLNATMLANPYILVTTLIVGAVAAMLLLKNETERMREAEKRYEEQKQKVIEAEQKHKEEIDKLCSVAGDEAVSTDLRREALHKLEQKYPDIFAKYQTETEMLENIKQIKQEIAELDGQISITNPKNELADVEKRIQELKAKATSYRTYRWVDDPEHPGNKIQEWYDSTLFNSTKDQTEYNTLMKKRDSLKAQVRKNDTDAYFANLTGISNDELNRQIQVRKDLLAKMDMSGSNRGTIKGDLPQAETYSRDELQAQLQQLERQKAYRDADSKSGAQWVAEKKKTYEDARKAYNDYINGITSKDVKEEDFKKKAEELKGQMEAAKKAYDKVKPETDKADSKKDNVRQQNNDMLANAASNRRKQEEEYAKQLADQVKDSEFEIRQARIDAMKDGIDKELMQNELNYDRLKEQNKRRLRDMLDNLAQERIRRMEDEDPNMFKKKNKDGKLEDDPLKRDEKYREIRAKLTIDNLDSQQQSQIEEFGRIAAAAFTQSNKESMDKMLQDVMTYEQQRTKITEEYARKRKDLYEKNSDGSTKTDADGNPSLRKGASQGNLDELNRQETEALKAIDEQFAQREETYKAWCEEIASQSLRQLEEILSAAKAKLAELEQSENANEKDLAVARAQVNKADQAVKTAKAKNDVNPGKRTIKEWEDLYKTLNDVEKEFESIGDTVGGTVGEIISACGSVATSSLQMINGIMTLVNWSVHAEQLAAQGASNAIQQVEKASVILTVISAALQIGMQLVNLFNNDERKQKEIEHLQGLIDQLQWELDHQEIGRVQSEYGTAISRLNKALMESRRELAAGATGWQRFAIMSERASRNTELMQKTAEKLAKAYGNVAYSADKALGGAKYQQANEQLKNIAQQQILIQEQINAEASKKKTDYGAIQEWENKIEELGQQALELINEMVEDIIGDTSTGIAEQLADAFFDAFQAGEDAAKAWGDKVNEIVADIVKRMLISEFLEKPLGEVFDKYKAKWFKGGEFQGIDTIIDSMEGFATDLNAVGANFTDIWEKLPESVKNMAKVIDTTSQSSTYGGFETMSQDTGTELNGRFAAMQLCAESIRDIVAEINEEIKSNFSYFSEIRTLTEELRNIALIAIDRLDSIDQNTHELYQMNERLDKIERNTRKL